jgi:Cu2+-containing amine oxidase
MRDETIHRMRMLAQVLIGVWYTFGLTHVPRPEDFPGDANGAPGFKLLPKGFLTATQPWTL